MNVAIFASAFHPHLGGVEELCRQLGREYLRRGMGVVVVTNRWPGDLPESEEFEGMQVLRVPMRIPEGRLRDPARYGIHAASVRRRILSVLREHQIDLVHIQCVSGNGHYALAAAREMSVPLVVTTQGERTMDAARLYERSRYMNKLLRRLLDEADFVTACSRDTLKDVEIFRGGSFGRRGDVIYNGITLADFESAEPYRHPRPYILGIGRMVTQKGFDLLIRAYAQLGEVDHDLLIAGDGPERTPLTALAGSLNLSDRVRFLGRAERGIVPGLFKGSSFFVLPSRLEPQGIVNLEAMACGKAVVAARVGGVPEIVADGETGILFEGSNVEDLSAALRRVVSSAELRESLGQAGREKAQKFSWPAIADQYLEVYDAAKRRAARRMRPMAAASDRPTVCHIFETVGPYSAIGKIAAAGVEAALKAGYRVSVVARLLDDSLRDDVEWLKLYTPPRGFAVQWLSARHYVRRTLGERKFDIVHAHQPQVASMADVFQCHFLTRAAEERGCMRSGRGLRARTMWLQQQFVLRAEDLYYGRWNPGTHMLYNSDLTRTDFHRLYGAPPRESLLIPASHEYRPATAAQRRAARQQFVGEHGGIVLGYLGGDDVRKGWQRLLNSVGTDPDIFLLMAGPLFGGMPMPIDRANVRRLNFVNDTEAFFAACDVVIVPSIYEPLGLVAFEAAARGVPVIATEEVGAVPYLLEDRAGAVWRPGHEPLPPLVRKLAGEREQFQAGQRALCGRFSLERYDRELMGIYECILADRGRQHAALAETRVTAHA